MALVTIVVVIIVVVRCVRALNTISVFIEDAVLAIANALLFVEFERLLTL